MNLNLINPNPKKALFLAQKQLGELVCDAVNLEGVNYTLPEIQTLLDGITVGGHKQTDELITLNQINAYKFLFDCIKNDSFNLSKEFVFKLHHKVAKEEAMLWGKFRTGGVTISGTAYLPPKHHKLAELWQKLTNKTIPSEINGIYQYAISLFLQMARMQFFYDGNKRTGRLMMNGVLLSKGLLAINLPAKKQLQFNQLMLSFYSSNNEKPMQDFMLSCVDSRHIDIMNEKAMGSDSIALLI